MKTTTTETFEYNSAGWLMEKVTVTETDESADLPGVVHHIRGEVVGSEGEIFRPLPPFPGASLR